MTGVSKLEVKSNVLLGAINVAMVVIVYALIIVLAHVYLVRFHGIDMLYMFESALFITEIPFIGELFKFSEHLVTSLVTDAFLIGLVYAAYISNHALKVEGTEATVQTGFLVVSKEKFKLEDIEQVYVEKYNFFPEAGALCVKALNEDTLKIPYVHNAEAAKNKLIELVKERKADLQLEEHLKEDIRVVT